MSEAWIAFCDHPELAIDLSRATELLRVPVSSEVVSDPFAAAVRALESGRRVTVLVTGEASAQNLVRLAIAAKKSERWVPLALMDDPRMLALAGDLGLPTVDEVRPLASLLALLSAGASEPWRASTRGLSPADRTRLIGVTGGRAEGSFRREHEGLLGWSPGDDTAAVPVGEPRDCAAAIAAWADAVHGGPPAPRPGPSPQRGEVSEILFGPPRALSDPASKRALRPYGIPFPVEELCASPSRAAAEATRIGFPVRIALASPDLRVWDHPDLAADGVDNAARVRDVYRQLTAVTEARSPDARILGVTVTATTLPRALLRVGVEALGPDAVCARIGFADPHGLASGDETSLALPSHRTRIERALLRLEGHPLILGGSAAWRKQTVGAIADTLERTAAFVLDHASEITRIDLRPLAILIDGTVEVREACIGVGDAFVRTLDAPIAEPA